jgi:hypothetical protein
VQVLCLCESTGRQQCCDEPLGAAKPLFCVILRKSCDATVLHTCCFANPPQSPDVLS